MPVFGLDPSPGLPPVGVARFHGHEMPPGPPTPGRAHAHDFVSLAYFEAAGGSLWLDDRRFEVRAGDVFLVAPGQVIAHDPGADRHTDAIGWGVFFSPEAFGSTPSGTWLSWRSHPLLSPFVGGVSGASQRLVVPPGDRAAWSARMGAMAAELQRRDDGHHEAVRAHLTLLLVEVARLAGPITEGVRTGDDRLLAHVFDMIEERYADGISLSDVAGAVSLTPGHLTTVVRQRTGRTVLEWITERRMVEARRLLVHTDLPVQEVARRVGYDDPAYFTRAFRRTHDTSPTGWRGSRPR